MATQPSLHKFPKVHSNQCGYMNAAFLGFLDRGVINVCPLALPSQGHQRESNQRSFITLAFCGSPNWGAMNVTLYSLPLRSPQSPEQ